MTTAEEAAAPFVPNMPTYRTDAPGQFGFADASRVNQILHESGWGEIEINAIDIDCAFPERELISYLTRLGALGRILKQIEEPRRSRIVEIVRTAFDPFIDGSQVKFSAACWLVDARASA